MRENQSLYSIRNLTNSPARKAGVRNAHASPEWSAPGRRNPDRPCSALCHSLLGAAGRPTERGVARRPSTNQGEPHILTAGLDNTEPLPHLPDTRACPHDLHRPAAHRPSCNRPPRSRWPCRTCQQGQGELRFLALQLGLGNTCGEVAEGAFARMPAVSAGALGGARQLRPGGATASTTCHAHLSARVAASPSRGAPRYETPPQRPRAA